MTFSCQMAGQYVNISDDLLVLTYFLTGAALPYETLGQRGQDPVAEGVPGFWEFKYVKCSSLTLRLILITDPNSIRPLTYNLPHVGVTEPARNRFFRHMEDVLEEVVRR